MECTFRSWELGPCVRCLETFFFFPGFPGRPCHGMKRSASYHGQRVWLESQTVGSLDAMCEVTVNALQPVSLILWHPLLNAHLSARLVDLFASIDAKFVASNTPHPKPMTSRSRSSSFRAQHYPARIRSASKCMVAYTWRFVDPYLPFPALLGLAFSHGLMATGTSRRERAKHGLTREGQPRAGRHR